MNKRSQSSLVPSNKFESPNCKRKMEHFKFLAQEKMAKE